MPVPTIELNELMEPGEHILQLNAVKVREVKVTIGARMGEMAEKWVWEFSSDRTNSVGDPQTISVWTGTSYGSSEAHLTKLLNRLVPGITPEQAKAFNTDDIHGDYFKALI